ncbi:DedA family protein [Parapusillimonas granuli]|uniref:DedA family protein n=1 Tax=Parapusillimonas granuli TaxID=380911 RepID=A0A853G5J5_9BURK|nr:DedA family protein [Parapusillimonas granuli]MBB5216986.1 membrane protein DedA with SNARE-associated domain [Parapusillimonas granuli]MEB2400684.1 DedA family protein [Alcaligenaceae bacterium]NYT50250.1 DedA family protein [Parapusillimonas granuli]
MASWIESILNTHGVWGVALLMFLENVFPPIPSELIMTLSGFAASRGETSIALVIVAGTLGSLAGALFWYGIGRLFDQERVKRFADRHGRWLTLTRSDLERTDRWFDEHGHWAVLLGRLIPTIRTLISIPAGFSEMPVGRFLIYTSIGTTVWTAFLALFGYWLGNDYQLLEEWLDPVSLGVVALVVVVYVWRFITFPGTRRD